MSFTARTEMLIGKEGVTRLAKSRVAVFGLGGVGGHACEALVRAGVGGVALFDCDRVSPSNLNRQLVALLSTLGQQKVDAMARRIQDIHPGCRVEKNAVFYSAENAADYPLGGYDYIVDAIDTVSSKLVLVEGANRQGVPIISSMGTGNKMHPEQLEIADIYQTSICPLARVMRKELKKRGIERLKVVYSKETPLPGRAEENEEGADSCIRKAPPPGSISFVPAAAGLLLAGAAVRDILAAEEGEMSP